VQAMKDEARGRTLSESVNFLRRRFGPWGVFRIGRVHWAEAE
jgi:hypothetical protein